MLLCAALSGCVTARPQKMAGDAPQGPGEPHPMSVTLTEKSPPPAPAPETTAPVETPSAAPIDHARQKQTKALTEPARPLRTTLAGPALQKETLSLVIFHDEALAGGGVKCNNRKVIKTEVIEQSRDFKAENGRPVEGSWTERWTLDRCGTPVRYRVLYTFGEKGTTYFTVKQYK